MLPLGTKECCSNVLAFVHAIARLEIKRDTRPDKQDKTKQDKTRQDLDKEKTAKPEERVLPLGKKECCPYKRKIAALTNERLLPNKEADKTRQQTQQGSRQGKAADKRWQHTIHGRRERGSVQQCGVGGAKGRQIFERRRENVLKNILNPHLHCYVQT